MELRTGLQVKQNLHIQQLSGEGVTSCGGHSYPEGKQSEQGRKWL